MLFQSSTGYKAYALFRSITDSHGLVNVYSVYMYGVFFLSEFWYTINIVSWYY